MKDLHLMFNWVLLVKLVLPVQCYASAGISRHRVCRCVCVSVTCQYCIKAAKCGITQATPCDSPGTL